MSNVLSTWAAARQRLLEANKRVVDAGTAFDAALDEQRAASKAYNEALADFDRNYEVQ